MQLVQVVFFCHCLAPLEVDLMESVEVFLEYASSASVYLTAAVLALVGVSSTAFLGAISLAQGRLLVARTCSALVCVSLALGWLVVG